MDYFKYIIYPVRIESTGEIRAMYYKFDHKNTNLEFEILDDIFDKFDKYGDYTVLDFFMSDAPTPEYIGIDYFRSELVKHVKSMFFLSDFDITLPEKDTKTVLFDFNKRLYTVRLIDIGFEWVEGIIKSYSYELSSVERGTGFFNMEINSLFTGFDFGIVNDIVLGELKVKFKKYDGIGFGRGGSVGGNSGYVGYSMSKRAVAARNDGKFPKTDFKNNYDITDKSLKTLVENGYISNSEWHHTSSYGNKTYFYEWNDDMYLVKYEQNKDKIDLISRKYYSAKISVDERNKLLDEILELMNYSDEDKQLNEKRKREIYERKQEIEDKKRAPYREKIAQIDKEISLLDEAQLQYELRVVKREFKMFEKEYFGYTREHQVLSDVEVENQERIKADANLTENKHSLNEINSRIDSISKEQDRLHNSVWNCRMKDRLLIEAKRLLDEINNYQKKLDRDIVERKRQIGILKRKTAEDKRVDALIDDYGREKYNDLLKQKEYVESELGKLYKLRDIRREIEIQMYSSIFEDGDIVKAADFDNSENSCKFAKISNDEKTNDIISGKVAIINSDAIQAAASHIGGSKRTSQMAARKLDFKEQEKKLIAPNGKPSNLTPEQYKLVRTPEFRAWFGDWDKERNIEKFLKSEDIVYDRSLNKIEIPTSIKNDTSKLSWYFIDAVCKNDSKNIQVNDDINSPLKITKKCVKKILSHNAERTYHVVLSFIHEIIKNAVFITSMNNTDENEKRIADIPFYLYFMCGVNFYGKSYTVYIVAEKYKYHGLRVYDISIINKNKIELTNEIRLSKHGSEANSILHGKDTKLFSIMQINPSEISKVVDNHGEPRTIFHGTDGKFNIFDKSKWGKHDNETLTTPTKGFFFTTEKWEAEDYGGLILKNCFLNIKKPLIIEQNEFYGIRKSYPNSTYFDKFSDSIWNIFNEGCYDGVILKSGRGDELCIAFEPNQIKLADGTNTTFDIENPDIRFEKGGSVTPETIMVDGIERPTRNSDGKYIHSTITGIENFWRWFGDSRVIDDIGRPMVVYHRTDSKFNIFDMDKLGEKSQWGTAYFGFYFANKNDSGGYGKNIMRCYLNISNPYLIESETFADFDYDYKRFDVDEFKQNDGIFIFIERLIGEDKSDKNFVVFNPNQIKSATGNNGDFDPNNTDIRYEKGGKIKYDRSGNPIGEGGWNIEPEVFDFHEYPQVKSSVDKSQSTESTYVTYRNTDNDKKITVRFSQHENNAVKLGEQLNGEYATKNEILYHLGLRKREFTPEKFLSIWNTQVAKKNLLQYEEADKTIQDMYALGAGADISMYKGKLAKGSNYLILGDTVEELIKQEKDFMGNAVNVGRYSYSEFEKGGNVPTPEQRREFEARAKELIDSIPSDKLQEIKDAYTGAINKYISDEQGTIENIEKKIAENTEFIEKSREAEKAKIGAEKYDEIKERTQRHIDNKLLIQKERFHQNNLIALRNGGEIAIIDDKIGGKIEAANFTKINSSDIDFTQETILNKPTPKFIPMIGEEEFEVKGFVLDAIRVSRDAYLIAVNGYKNRDASQRSDVKQNVILSDEEKSGYVLMTLDQLVLTNLYYIEKAKALKQKYADEKNERNERYFDELPDSTKERHYSQEGLYNSLPVRIKKIVSREKWNSMTWQEKVNTHKFFTRHAAKRITTKLEDNQMWASFHIMYNRFLNPDARPTDKNKQVIDEKTYYGTIYGNPEVFEYWHVFRDFMNYKIKDIQIQREDLSEVRKAALETSFGMSNTNDVLKDKFGVLVKHQDGSKISVTSIDQIEKAISRIYATFGNMKAKALSDEMKISHTQNRFVFASKAIGTYVPQFATIAVSDKFGDNEFQSTMSHETAHWIDSLLGRINEKRYATDDYESLAGQIAFSFRRGMNVKSDNDYINATKECFARAFQQYFAITNFGDDAETLYSYNPLNHPTPYFTEDNFVSKSYYYETMKPMIEKFLEENRELLVKQLVSDENETAPKIEPLPVTQQPDFDNISSVFKEGYEAIRDSKNRLTIKGSIDDYWINASEHNDNTFTVMVGQKAESVSGTGSNMNTFFNEDMSIDELSKFDFVSLIEKDKKNAEEIRKKFTKEKSEEQAEIKPDDEIKLSEEEMLTYLKQRAFYSKNFENFKAILVVDKDKIDYVTKELGLTKEGKESGENLKKLKDWYFKIKKEYRLEKESKDKELREKRTDENVSNIEKMAIEAEAEMQEKITARDKPEKHAWEMTRTDVRDFLDKQATSKNNRVLFDNWNKDETYEYAIPKDIDFGNDKYNWDISSKHKHGTQAGFTNPYIIVVKSTYVEMPKNITGSVDNIIRLDEFSIGNDGLKRKHANHIIDLLRKDQIKKALSEGKPIPAEILAEYPELQTPTEINDEERTMIELRKSEIERQQQELDLLEIELSL